MHWMKLGKQVIRLFKKEVWVAVKEKSEKKPVEQKMHVVEIILCVILITVFVFVKCIAVESMKIRRDIFYTISSTEEGIEDAAKKCRGFG